MSGSQVFISFVIKTQLMKLLDFNRIFPDDASCKEYLRTLREHEGGVVCPIVLESAITGTGTTNVGLVLPAAMSPPCVPARCSITASCL